MIAIPRTPPSAPAQMVVTLSVSDNAGGFGLLQSLSVRDSSSTGQVESTLSTVPVTVRDGPLPTHDENSMTKSSAEYVPTGLV